jgi:hypothetical protein
MTRRRERADAGGAESASFQNRADFVIALPPSCPWKATTAWCIFARRYAFEEIHLQNNKVVLSLGRAALAMAVIVPLAACDNMSRSQQRTLSGGALGAAGGAAVGAIAGGSLVTGAVVGGAVGAAAGALTSGR